PLGGESRLLLENAYGPEPLQDGSLIVVKPTDRSDHQLYRFWPDSGRLEGLPAFIRARDVEPNLRAFPSGKEIVYYGVYGEDKRSENPRLLVLDLTSNSTRELVTGLQVDDSDAWCALAVAPDGASVYVLTVVDDSRAIVRIPRRGGAARTMMSFPQPAAPLHFDVASDGTMLLDYMPTMASALWIQAGGIVREAAVARLNEVSFLPGGEVLSTLSASGK